MIDVFDLSKVYSVSKRSEGLGSALRHFIRPEYTEVQALNSISFHIDPGEIVGYMGPNGAGKSTTIKIMSGILRPSSGHCLIDGKVPWLERRAHVSTLGVVFGQRSQLWWDTPVIDSFNLLKEIYRIKDAPYKLMRDQLAEALDLSQLLTVPVRQLSLGQRMRCEVAASLIHKPKILFLDEPTIGLDAISKLAIRDFIKQMNKELEMTVILTTHDTADLEALCKRVMLIGKGELLYDGNFDALKTKYTPERILEVIVAGTCINPRERGWKVVDENRLIRRYNPNQVTMKALLDTLEGCEVLDLVVSNPPVDEMIARLYQEHAL